MHPEIGATELLVIAAVALIVVGPKDLPLLLRKLGQFLGRLRTMAADFRASFDEMARQSELDELRAEVEAMRKSQMSDIAALQASDAQVSGMLEEINQGLTASGAGAGDPDGMAAAPAPEPASPPAPKPKAAIKRAATPEAAAPAAKKPARPKAAKSAAPKPRARKGGVVT